MKLRKILSLAAAAAIAMSTVGCSIKVNTNDFESVITSIKLDDEDVVAKPTGEAHKDDEALAMMVALAVCVVDHGDVMSMIAYVVKTEVCPLSFWYQRINNK